MLIYPQYLSFEVTRRCNLNCRHCMRGDSQCLDMSEEVVRRTLDSILELHYINFTGGEPSLNTELIGFIVSEIKSRAIDVYGFDVVTNGVDSVRINKLIDILTVLKDHCFDKHIDTSRLAISIDEYHKQVQLPFRECNFSICNKRELDGILNIGRARALDCDKVDKSPVFVNVLAERSNALKLGNSIVVSANGDVRLSVDYEYDSTDGVIGNILETPLEDMISNKIKEQKEFRGYYSWR